jgi:hypothetical protein
MGWQTIRKRKGSSRKALPIKNPEKDMDKACEKLVKQFDKDVRVQQKKR